MKKFILNNIKIIAILIFMLIYYILSIKVAKPYLLPYLKNIIDSLYALLNEGLIFKALSNTVMTTISMAIISFIIAIFLVCLSLFNHYINDFLSPLLVISKVMPMASISLVAIIWFTRKGAVNFFILLMLVPMLYENIYSILNDIQVSYSDILNMLDLNYFTLLNKIYFPLAGNRIFDYFRLSISYAYKVCIMAELLTQKNGGIGYYLSVSKANMLSAEMFAWLIIIFISALLLDYLLQKIKFLLQL